MRICLSDVFCTYFSMIPYLKKNIKRKIVFYLTKLIIGAFNKNNVEMKGIIANGRRNASPTIKFQISCKDRRPRRFAKTKILIITPNRDCISNFIANGRRNASPTIKFKVLSYGSFFSPAKFLPMSAVWVEIPLTTNPHALFARGCYPPRCLPAGATRPKTPQMTLRSF